MSGSEEIKPRKSALWLRILLFGSLAVNLLIVGMVAGAFLRGGPGSKEHRRDIAQYSDLGLGPFGRALAQPERQNLRREMNNQIADLRENRDRFKNISQSLLEALRAVPYDPDLVQQIVSRQQDNLLERQNIGKSLLLSQIEKMDDLERSRYADRLEKSLRWREKNT